MASSDDKELDKLLENAIKLENRSAIARHNRSSENKETMQQELERRQAEIRAKRQQEARAIAEQRRKEEERIRLQEEFAKKQVARAKVEKEAEQRRKAAIEQAAFEAELRRQKMIGDITSQGTEDEIDSMLGGLGLSTTKLGSYHKLSQNNIEEDDFFDSYNAKRSMELEKYESSLRNSSHSGGRHHGDHSGRHGETRRSEDRNNEGSSHSYSKNRSHESSEQKKHSERKSINESLSGIEKASRKKNVHEENHKHKTDEEIELDFIAQYEREILDEEGKLKEDTIFSRREEKDKASVQKNKKSKNKSRAKQKEEKAKAKATEKNKLKEQRLQKKREKQELKEQRKAEKEPIDFTRGDVYKVAGIVLLVAMIGAAGYFGRIMYIQYQANKEFENLAAQVNDISQIDDQQDILADKIYFTEDESESEINDTENNTEEPKDDSSQTNTKPEKERDKNKKKAKLTYNQINKKLKLQVPKKNLDWDKIKKVNSDIYAWIYIPNTNIDYPILQSDKGEEYYLNRNMNGTDGKPGCIFTQNLNGKDFKDYNTVIYGHNMRAGTMFRTLHNFEDAEFFKKNPFVYIYTPVGNLVYEIFEAYTGTDAHILKNNDFHTEEGYGEYLDEIINNNIGIHRGGINVTTRNHIITLSTCTSVSDQRWLVHGVLVNDPSIYNE